MSWLRRPRRPVVPDRRDELDVASMANAAALADAQAALAHAVTLAQRIARVHAALMHEGAKNHFTERFEAAYRGGPSS